MSFLLAYGYFCDEVDNKLDSILQACDKNGLTFNSVCVWNNIKSTTLSASAHQSRRISQIYFPRRLSEYKSPTPELLILIFKGIFLFLVDHRYRRLLLYELALSLNCCKNVFSSLAIFLRCFAALAELQRVINSSWKSEFTHLVIWGIPLGVSRLVADVAESKNVKVIYAEYGEVPGYFCMSREGGYHKSCVARREAEFVRRAVSVDELQSTRQLVEWMANSKATSKRYTSGNLLLPGKAQNATIVFVNGVDECGSGLIPRSTRWSKAYSPKFRSNRDLLLAVLKLSEKLNFFVIYKDHPNVFQFNKSRAIRGLVHPNLYIADDVNVHEILNASSAVVSIGSKTVLLAVCRNIPVVLVGPFTFGPVSLPMCVFNSGNLKADLQRAIEIGVPVKRSNSTDVVTLLAQLIKYYLFPLSNSGACPIQRVAEKNPWFVNTCHKELL